GVIFQENLWARPQAVVTIQAPNENEFLEIFEENKGKIISFFLKAERDRLARNYMTYYEKDVYKILDEHLGLTMNIAPGFQVASQKEDFIWLRYLTPAIEQGIIIYNFPYVSDSAFNADYQLRVRDSLLRANV